MHKLLGTLALAGLVTAPVFAQADADAAPAGHSVKREALPVDPTINPAALGDQTFGPIDVGVATGQTGVLGVQYLNGRYYVTARVILPDGVTRNNEVYVFNSAGTLVDQFDQFGTAFTNAWGYRDGFTDGTFVYFGYEGGVVRHAATAPYTATQIINTAGPNGNWRALAYNPAGNNGAGSIYMGDFGDPIYETTMTGTTIRSFPNLDAWSFYGLAFDPCTGNLWGTHSSGASVAPEIWEVDTTTGRWTGLTFPFDYGVPGSPFPIQGGLTEVPGGAGGSGNFFDFAAILQATSDALVGGEIYANDCFGGGLELTSSGTCPGAISFTVTGGTPGGNGALVYGFGTGPTTIPNTFPCAGTQLNVGNPNLDYQTIRFDASGNATFRATVPSSACRVNVQALDIATCTTSNVINP